MSFDSEAVTLAGSGLVFVNYYDQSVTAAYRDAIIAAEHELQSHFTNPVTINTSFDLKPLDAGSAAQNSYSVLSLTYGALTSSLRAHATSADDHLAANGFPATDPSAGAGWAVTPPQARILGLAAQANEVDLDVSLNSNLAWIGQDAIGAIQHELTEGGFGRIASLGLQAARWEPLDLFRFTADGARDYAGGADGVATYFGLDSFHVTSLAYHDAISATGQDDGQDLGDWEATHGDAFGPGGPNAPGSMSATDLRVLDVLGWNSAPYTPPPDEFASSPADTAHALGSMTAGGAAVSGVLQSAGDRDLFQVQLQAGISYVVKLAGQFAGGGTLADPYLRLDDSAGAVVASDDDIVNGSNPDSQIVFTPQVGGTYYVEAGAFVDGYAGSYTVSLSGGGPGQPTAGADALQASAAMTEIHGGAGNDTITGWAGGDFLTGDDGGDVINGGAGFDRTNGNAGNDTVHGAAGDDWVTGGRDNDVLYGDDGADIINGNLGNDAADGGAGADVVRGGQGDDVLAGGADNDYLTGDLGDDTLQGGDGADTFRAFAGGGSDVILDFNPAQGDRIQLDPGTSHSEAQSGGDVIISLGGGAQTILKGVQLASLTPGWILGG